MATLRLLCVIRRFPLTFPRLRRGWGKTWPRSSALCLCANYVEIRGRYSSSGPNREKRSGTHPRGRFMGPIRRDNFPWAEQELEFHCVGTLLLLLAPGPG